jgi:hypothetical protein
MVQVRKKLALPTGLPEPLVLDYRVEVVGRSCVLHADCFEWLSRLPENSLHAIVTDPPYGGKEYDLDQIVKRANGNGGIWRIPLPLTVTRALRSRASLHSLRKSANRSSISSWSGRE